MVTWALVAANLLVWLIVEGTGSSAHPDLRFNSEDPDVLLDFGAMFAPLIADGEYWRLFTAIFLHGGPGHLLLNSLALFTFGGLVVERLYGHVRFTFIYVLAGLSGSVASYLLSPITVGVGASGAIFGLLGALAAFFASSHRVLGEVGRQTMTGILVAAGILLVWGFSNPQIDNWAHLGGLAGGFAVGLAFAPQYRSVPLQVPFGQGYRLMSNGIAVRRWLLIGAVVALLVIGATLGTATVPDNAVSRLQEAERLIKDERFGAAIEELRAARRLAIEERNADALVEIGRLMNLIR